MRSMYVGPVLGLAIMITSQMVDLTYAEHDLAQRLRHDAQVQSNNGHYKEAQQLRTIADALKNKDAATAYQAQVEIGKGQLDKAMALLKAK
jgi:hypothetical protein